MPLQKAVIDAPGGHSRVQEIQKIRRQRRLLDGEQRIAHRQGRGIVQRRGVYLGAHFRFSKCG
ncbi:hypothetical protein OMP38_22245 [Cohnella ginsengisoli]|uniref:Uncharacterized protein n=1 Tax=Cohnella ginsengisoli TaxID=425004 RepID=A0A9X4KNF9_9BACL|nr:hypothetical protein [Cohnella ginsengisoli]MDG0793262.1 hypothetical protein [Cohnella ginsengisoli]